MKKFLLFLSIFSVSLFAQDIPNAGFENWTLGNPDNWITDNIPAFPGFPGAITVTQSADNHSGSSAVKMEIITLVEGIYPPELYAFFPATQRYGSLMGYYKFLPQRQSDILSMTVTLFSGSLISGLGIGVWESNVTASSYTQFSIPIEYNSSETPDSAWIFIIVQDTSEIPAAGAYAIIDDLSWGGVVAVKGLTSNVPSEFAMKQNYPNPFNPSTRIEYTTPEASFVQLKVYDIVGNELTTLVNEYQPAGTFRAEFNAANLSSGIYIAKLTAGSFTKTMKMTLLK
ncbi:MAG: T9SS type A sorting domain-containing protein [Ignavibacteria bacterium]